MSNKATLILILLLTVCMLLLPDTVGTAVAAEQLTDDQWQKLTNDKAFGYSKETELAAPKKPSATDNIFSTIIAAIVLFFSSGMGKMIVWVLLFLLIGFALFRILSADRTGLFKRRKEQPEDEGNDQEVLTEDMLHTNWEEYIDKATREGNTRMAVRDSYMMLLQLLQKRQLIQYRTDKTNYDYYYELANTNLKNPFRLLTRQYEYAWYGNYPIQEEAYQEYLNTFNNLKSQLYRS